MTTEQANPAQQSAAARPQVDPEALVRAAEEALDQASADEQTQAEMQLERAIDQAASADTQQTEVAGDLQEETLASAVASAMPASAPEPQDPSVQTSAASAVEEAPCEPEPQPAAQDAAPEPAPEAQGAPAEPAEAPQAAPLREPQADPAESAEAVEDVDGSLFKDDIVQLFVRRKEQLEEATYQANVQAPDLQTQWANFETLEQNLRRLSEAFREEVDQAFEELGLPREADAQ